MVPTIMMEVTSARGTFRSGFFTIANNDAAHSKPKNPKIIFRVALSTLLNPCGAKGNRLLMSSFVKHISVVAISGNTVVQIKIYCPISDSTTPNKLSVTSVASVVNPSMGAEIAEVSCER